MYNCIRMEEQLQRKYDHLAIGFRRLWQWSGAGDKYKDVHGKCMVYIMFSCEVVQKLHNGNLIDGNDALTTAYDRTHREGIFLGRR